MLNLRKLQKDVQKCVAKGIKRDAEKHRDPHAVKTLQVVNHVEYESYDLPMAVEEQEEVVGGGAGDSSLSKPVKDLDRERGRGFGQHAVGFGTGDPQAASWDIFAEDLGTFQGYEERLDEYVEHEPEPVSVKLYFGIGAVV